MHLGGAVLFVKDLPRMREFYGDMLQARPCNQECTDSYALFELNGGRLVLHAIPEEYRATSRSRPHHRNVKGIR